MMMYAVYMKRNGFHDLVGFSKQEQVLIYCVSFFFLLLSSIYH